MSDTGSPEPLVWIDTLFCGWSIYPSIPAKSFDIFICICISTSFLLIKAILSAQALVLHTTFPILRPMFEDVSLSSRGFTYSLYKSVLNMPPCRTPWSTSNWVRPIIRQSDSRIVRQSDSRIVRQSDSPTNAIFLWKLTL